MWTGGNRLGALLGLALAGCGSSGSAGTTAGDGSAEASNGGSDDGSNTPRPGDAGAFALSSLDEPCEGGPTGRQLLAYVEARYAGTYVPPTSHPDAGPSALTITASYDGGAIECTPAPPFNCCQGCPCRTPPPPTVTVDLDVGFRTADGTLDESFVAAALFSPDVYLVQWTATLPRAMVRGTYAFETSSTDLLFSGNFRNASTYGNLSEEGPTTPGTSTLSGGTWTGSGVDAGTD